jgi:PEP-CTERM motif
MKVRSLAILAAVVGTTAAISFHASADVLYNPVVAQVGDGSAIGSGAGVTTTIETFTNSVANQPAPVASLAYTGLVNTNSTVEGMLSNSPSIADAAAAGQAFTGTAFVYSAGYAGSDNTAAVTTTASRVVGSVAVGANSLSNAAIDVTQPESAAYTGSTFRAAAGDDTATNVWTAGTAGTGQTATAGFRYFNSNAIIPSGTLTNTRTVETRNGQVFGGTSSGSTVGVYALGSDTPLTSQTATSLISTGTSSNHAPEQFVLVTDPNNTQSTANTFGYNVAYIADDGTAASETPGAAGIEKWVLGASGWTNVYTITDGVATGYRGLAAQLDPATGNVILWATTADGTKLEQFADPLEGISNALADASSLTLATAPANDLFRGVALSPAAAVAATPEPASLALVGTGILALAVRRRRN